MSDYTLHKKISPGQVSYIKYLLFNGSKDIIDLVDRTGSSGLVSSANRINNLQGYIEKMSKGDAWDTIKSIQNNDVVQLELILRSLGVKIAVKKNI